MADMNKPRRILLHGSGKTLRIGVGGDADCLTQTDEISKRRTNYGD